jgi:hypothetical protein
VKLHSGSIDESLNLLQIVLSSTQTQAARLTLREANRRYRELKQHYLRVIRAAERGAFDRSRRTRIISKRRAHGG